MADLVLALDGGGSKTCAELLDGDGRRLGGGRAGPCNLYRDAAAGLDALHDCWRQCCAQAGIDPVAAAARTIVSAGLAGAGAPAGRAVFRAGTAGFARAHLSSDAYTALLGAFEGGPGVLLIVGTGTVACRLDADGRFDQSGGWGFPAGDRGGGAWIGLQLVAAWLEHRDGIGAQAGEDAALWHAAERQIGTERAAILAWLRAAGPADYATLAPAVLRAAESGSPCARAIMDEAAAHLAALIASLHRPGLEVAFGGGLAPTFAARLGQQTFTRAASPLRGAWLVAVGRAPAEYAEAACA